jgi:hypothetical protein
VTTQITKNILNAIIKSIRMVPPLERSKLIDHLLKFYKKNCPASTNSFFQLFSGLIRAAEDDEIDCLWDSLSNDPDDDSISTIYKYLVRKVFWFKTSDSNRDTKAKLYDLKTSLSDESTRSRGNDSTLGPLLKVAIKVPELSEAYINLKRKRGEEEIVSPQAKRYNLF